MSRESKAQIMENVEHVKGSAKLVLPNTVQYTKPNGDVCFRFHHTDIIIKHKDGSFTLTSGGWKTKTTKERLNELTGSRISQSRGIWFIGDVPFQDGMKIKPNGEIANAKEYQKQANNELLMIKRINTYIKPILTLPELPKPSSGDCWLCLGLPSSDAEHIRNHIEEGYLFGSIIVNALKWAGYTKESISYFMTCIPGGNTLRKTVQTALRRYIKRQLGLAS